MKRNSHIQTSRRRKRDDGSDKDHSSASDTKNDCEYGNGMDPVGPALPKRKGHFYTVSTSPFPGLYQALQNWLSNSITTVTAAATATTKVQLEKSNAEGARKRRNRMLQAQRIFRCCLSVIGLLSLVKRLQPIIEPTMNHDDYVSAFESKPRMLLAYSSYPTKDMAVSSETQKRTTDVVVARVNPNSFAIEDAVFTEGNGSLRRSSSDISSPNKGTLRKDELRWSLLEDHIARKVDFIGGDWGDFQKLLSDSDDARERLLDPAPDGCVPQHDWQTQSFPTCNILHEQSMVDQLLHHHHREGKPFLLGQGAYRSVWLAMIQQEQFALKTLNYDHSSTERRIERHRLDALVAERLTASPYVLDVYAYCANAALYAFASGGSLEDLMNKGEIQKWSSSRKLDVAFQVAAAVADLHDINHNGIASVVHGDIDTSQFVRTNNDGNSSQEFQLNDFNGARLLYYDPDKHNGHSSSANNICPVDPSLYGGNHRSPEDYAGQRVTEKSDVYSLGNVLYAILTGRFPFSQYDMDKAQELIQQGRRDELPSNDSDDDKKDPRIQAIIDSIKLAWKSEVQWRGPARRIAAILQSAIYHNE